MCSVVILRRPNHAWPLLLAANRDEMRDRPWDPPARHWSDRPEVIAGYDRLSGGSWLGLNDHGVVAAVLNRSGSLGPAPDKRSRGELVLEALDHADASEAAEQLRHLETGAYRSFNLFVADNRDAFWLRSTGHFNETVRVAKVTEGISMLTARELNDLNSPRIARHLPLFQSALAPDPDLDDWDAWKELLGTTGLGDPMDGMVVSDEKGFETVSSSLIALPESGLTLAGEPIQPIWLFAAGRPDRFPYQVIQI
ncbi:MAG: NRDE family protein [Kiloniellales bacterium]|nr:NRDE family protein [Kiloniellales bacterium]